MDVCWLQPPYIWGDCVDNLQLCLIQDLGNVLNRLRANKLTLNMTKTKFMLIGSRQTLSTLGVSLTITIYDSQASQFTTAKSLRVTIDNKLNWGSHIDKLTKKVPSGIGAIKRIWHLVPQATLLLTNQALMQPHFDYCNIVWGNCGITLQNKVQKLQNREARVLTYSNYDAEAGHLFELLRWKNLASQQQIQRAIMVYKSLHGLAPDYSYSNFERQETAHNLGDSEHKLNVPLLQTNYYKNSFSYSGATLWNRLPRDIRQAESLELFTCLIKEVCSGMAFVESSFS